LPLIFQAILDQLKEDKKGTKEVVVLLTAKVSFQSVVFA
jgi:hypothetical protein